MLNAAPRNIGGLATDHDIRKASAVASQSSSLSNSTAWNFLAFLFGFAKDAPLGLGGGGAEAPDSINVISLDAMTGPVYGCCQETRSLELESAGAALFFSLANCA